MKSVSLLRNLRVAALLGLGTVAISNFTVMQAKEVVRAKMAVPLKKAEQFMQQGKIAQAGEALKEAQRFPNPSAYEKGIIERLQIALAVKQNDLESAFAGYERLIASSRTTSVEKIQMRMAQASLAYRARQYPKAIQYIQTYFLIGGKNPHMTTLLIQSYFLNNNYREAMLAQQKQIDEETRNGQVPAESQWQIMANCQEKLGDQDGLRSSFIQLAIYYPKPEYWSRVMTGLTSVSGMSPAVRLEALRLRLVTGLMKTGNEYMEMAEIAMQVKLPHLALKIISEEQATGGVEKDASLSGRIIRFRNFVQNDIRKNQANLEEQIGAAQKLPDGEALLMLGYDLVAAGEGEKGLMLMRKALQKQIRDRDEALLHYAMAELDENHKKQAVTALQSVQGKGVVKEIASLWLMRLHAER